MVLSKLRNDKHRRRLPELWLPEAVLIKTQITYYRIKDLPVGSVPAGGSFASEGEILLARVI